MSATPVLASARAKPATHSVHHTDFGDAPPPDDTGPRLWARLAVAREALAGTEYDRQAKCLHTRIAAPGAGVTLHRAADGRTWVGGVARCGHWTCPACGVARARRAAAELGATLARHLGGGFYHDAWMLTLTVPHYAGDAAADLVAGLYSAARLFFRGRTWARFRRRWGVVGVVRALDVTIKPDGTGTHPHFHVAVLARKAAASVWQPLRGMTATERETWLEDVCKTELADAWAAAVLAAGFRPKSLETLRQVGAQLQPGDRVGSYLAGWGLDDETTGAPLKKRSHLALLDDGGDFARHMYYVWRDAVEGRQWLSGMADARAAVGVTDDDVAAHVEATRPKDDAPPVEPVDLAIPAYSWPAALRVGLGELLREVRAATDNDDARRRVWSMLDPRAPASLDDAPPPPAPPPMF